jgi:hypothetical protein
VNDLDERERDTWSRRPPMTKQDKLELIRQLKAQLTEPKDQR